MTSYRCKRTIFTDEELKHTTDTLDTIHLGNNASSAWCFSAPITRLPVNTDELVDERYRVDDGNRPWMSTHNRRVHLCSMASLLSKVSWYRSEMLSFDPTDVRALHVRIQGYIVTDSLQVLFETDLTRLITMISSIAKWSMRLPAIERHQATI